MKDSNHIYRLTTLDLYFGLGLVNNNQIEFNLQDFPYLELTLNYVEINEFAVKKVTIVPLELCNISLLMEEEDIAKLSNSTISYINKKLNYYMCPVKIQNLI